MSSTAVRLTFVAMAIFGAAACNGAVGYFSDDEGGRYDATLADHLSLPYAIGSTVAVDWNGEAAKAGWAFVTDSPSVIAISNQSVVEGKISVTLSPLTAGSSILRLIDDKGTERHRANLTVMAVDNVRAFSNALLRVNGFKDTGFEKSELTTADVLLEGKGAFQLGLFNGATPVYGHEFLTATMTGSALYDAKELQVNHLIVTPTATGSSNIEISHGTTKLLDFPVVAVVDTDLVMTDLMAEAHDDLKDSDDHWVYASIHDRLGNLVFGSYFSWTIDGAAQTGADSALTTGDLYRIVGSDKKMQLHTLAAKNGPASIDGGSLTVNAPAGGHVEISTYFGCSAAASSSSSLTTLLMCLAALVVVRRRIA